MPEGYSTESRNLERALTRAMIADPGLKRVVASVGRPEPRTRPPDFRTLLQIIASQQVSTQAASAINERLSILCGGKVTWRKILNRSDTQLRECGLSRSKVEYARGLAEMIRDKQLNLDQLASLRSDVAIEKLIQIRGIGRWSAQIFAMFALNHGDIFPSDDLALQVAVQRYHGLSKRPSSSKTEELAQRWSPERTAVALLMWKYYGAATLD